MEAPWVVEFYENAAGRSVLLDEVGDLLTEGQLARFQRQIKRLETYGPLLNGDYFDSVRGSRLGLGEFRLTLEGVEFRLLFSQERRREYVMLVAYKEKSGSIPRAKIATAERRLEEWRRRRHED